MKTIVVSVTNDINNDQRVAKVCSFLNANNYRVILVGRKLSNSKPLDRNYITKRFSLFFNTGILFYAEYNFRLFLFLLFQKKDILLANDLDTLVPNFIVSKLQNKKLVFDSHELFSEVPELLDKPFKKKIWQSLEKLIIPRLKNSYTVCNSIAKHYYTLYKTPFKVVRNVPVSKDVVPTKLNAVDEKKKIILYQGAINIGRGLELIINTIQYLDNYLLLIVGDGDITTDLQELVSQKKLTNKVRFLGKLAPTDLYKITPNAHLGISLEEDLGLNYRYALPNKIFDYVQAKVPVLVSNLPEMAAVVTQYKIGEVVKNRAPKALALQIEALLKKDYTQALDEAKKELIWGKETSILASVFNNLK